MTACAWPKAQAFICSSSYSWDITAGIRHGRSPMAVEELQELEAAPRLDRQAAASKAGILLEQLLDQLTRRYRCRLPRKDEAAYTLGELADAVDTKLARILRSEQIDDHGAWQSSELKPLIDAATDYTWVRNQVGAHFNIKSAAIPDPMIREFSKRVLALAEVMICRSCGQLPNKNKTGEYWECGGKCGKARLRPLQAPQ